ncbi:5'-nucleotidase [Salpingoeca rosetta]|uniref:5'-nucleotidase n=1 Tax=Salpingoeca rosetta (strain ATCC 50818 / BSB-021) TaxID=946362 RepID=F2URV5_SALR5|nr:5'-nucleotidase [Salpingoeca rosetta]EGD80360.1 5'-nucleotidase [Salpingoeca rosetta]|eukprot:XP_004988150.1 5'-nucleotidase [Salpingoeca rosetta]
MAENTAASNGREVKVVIGNQAAFDEKVAKLKKDGAKNLQVIADFDYTLTRFRLDDGKRSASTHAAIEMSKLMSEQFATETRANFEHYYPIEVSDIPHEDKEKAMIEWWTKSHELMIKHDLRREYLEDMAGSDRLVLRDGVKEFLQSLKDKGVPIHIFSAGLYDIIHVYLRLHGLEGMAHVVSNMMTFDDEGKLTGFKGELIHTLNKNSKALRDSPEWQQVQERTNVLLLGDNAGDIGMAKGLDRHTVLSVGFLNDREERLELYKQRYDVVLLGDGDMTYVRNLLADIVG